MITLITRESVWKEKILLNDPEITSRKIKTNTEKRKGRIETTTDVVTAGGLRVPAIHSPADIHTNIFHEGQHSRKI